MLHLTCETEPLRVDLDKATALGIVVTELVSNSYLHAFPDNVGAISVVLRVGSGRAVLTVSDNGVGFDQVETTRRGIGLVRRLVQQVDGSVSHRSDNGSIWTVVVAVADDARSATAA